MAERVRALHPSDLRDQARFVAGGAPVTQDFVDEIGADGYGSNATAAVEKAKVLVSG